MANELKSSCSTESPMECVSLSNFRPTIKEQLKVFCKPNYQIRKPKSKGANVILIRSFLVISLFYYIGEENIINPYYVSLGLTLPFAGWLADVVLGRHRVIHWSIWIMWIGFIIATASSVIVQLVDNYHNTEKYIVLVSLILASAGFGSYQANEIQFGLDQLHDASTDEITSFISWYVWTTFSGGIVMNFANNCVQTEYHILLNLLVCFCLSIALILSLLCDKMLIKEPVIQNPLKLVYRVINFAIKNKRPRCRSAFTSCEDDLPSRIDFGKTKYGGPFTTEQVEDVKTFFRLLAAIFFCSAMPCLVIMVNQLSNKLNDSHVPESPTAQCYMNKFYPPLTAVVLIPIYEFAIYPALRKCFSWVKSYLKFLLGVLLQMARAITLLVLTINARYHYLKHNDYNATIQCIFHEDESALESSFDKKWMLLPNLLDSLSIAILLISGVEFTCAQTPYSMRGLMFGAAYGGMLVFALIGYGIIQPFMNDSITWETGIISCGFWYMLLSIILLGADGIVLTILGILYKKRKREDVLPNEQIFAERYYAK